MRFRRRFFVSTISRREMKGLLRTEQSNNGQALASMVFPRRQGGEDGQELRGRTGVITAPPAEPHPERADARRGPADISTTVPDFRANHLAAIIGCLRFSNRCVVN